MIDWIGWLATAVFGKDGPTVWAVGLGCMRMSALYFSDPVYITNSLAATVYEWSAQ